MVTGANGGMGQAIVAAFREAGAAVLALDLGSEAVARPVSADAGPLHYLAGDVSDADVVAAAVREAETRFGPLTSAVNAAAIEFETVSIADCDDDDFDKMMAVNVRGVFLALKHQIRAMLASGVQGSIVNIASTNSTRPQHQQPAYTASKHAVVGLTKSAAIDYARNGIRVNAIAPGAIDTPMLHNAMERRGRTASEVAGRLSYFGRFGDPDEIAAAALWLCGNQSTFTTGHVLAVDGGMLAG